MIPRLANLYFRHQYRKRCANALMFGFSVIGATSHRCKELQTCIQPDTGVSDWEGMTEGGARGSSFSLAVIRTDDIRGTDVLDVLEMKPCSGDEAQEARLRSFERVQRRDCEFMGGKDAEIGTGWQQDWRRRSREKIYGWSEVRW